MLDVSLTLIVLNAKLPCWLWRTQTNNDDENRINTKTVTLFQNGTQTFNFCCSLGYGNMSIIFFNDFCKAIRIYIYARKKHLFISYLAAKHPKHSKFAVINIREKTVNFFNDTARALSLCPAIILQT